MSRANGEEPSFYQKYKNEKVKKNNFYTGFRKKASTPVNETYRENQFNQKYFPSLGNEKTEPQTQPQGVWGQGKKFIPLTKPVVTNTTEVKVEEPKVVKPKVEKTQVEKVNGEKQLTLDSWLKSKEEPKKVEPVKEEPKKVEPKKVEPVKEEPKKVEPVKEEPKKVEPVKEEPKKVEPVKEEPKKEEPKKVEQSNVQAPRMVQPKKFDVQEWAQKMKKHNPKPELRLKVDDFPTLGSPIVTPVSMGVWGGNMSKVFAKPQPKKKEVPVEETTRISPGVYAIKKNRENDKHLSIQSKRMMNISSHFSSINNSTSDDEEPYEREEPVYSEPEEVEDDEDDEEDDDDYY